LKKNFIIGVDVGGTKIMTGAITENGKILCNPIKFPTESNDEPDKIAKRIKDSIEKTIENSDRSIIDVKGIGLGVTGPLDIENGIILECPQLPTMHFFPLRKVIEEYFHVPVYMNNDANCLIYGETIFGAGMGKKNVVGFTLGTGLGCAIIINKEIFNGSTGTGSEMWISPYKEGTIENYVSGLGVARIFETISGKKKTALEVAILAEKGDVNALRTWDEFGKHLSVAISWAINFIDPELIILGGSIAKAFKFFSFSLEKHLRKQICPVPAKKTKVVNSKLGENAGFIGAAALFLQNT
jgi:glucokinase